MPPLSLFTAVDEIRRGSTERLWCGNVWCTQILYPSQVSQPLLFGVFQTGCPEEI